MANLKSQDVDIIVFPEYGLTSSGLHRLSEDQFHDMMQEFPPLKAGTFDNQTADNKVLRTLQDIAKNHQVYLAVNLGTKMEDPVTHKFNYYNTLLVFDRLGKIVARYRKYNLYGEEDLFSKPSVPDVSYFDTDFMVRFGLLICFDINYQQPFQDLKKNQVDVILLPSAWVDELPFLTAIQYHSGWALANKVTILSSGLHDPQNGALGAGIYHGEFGILNYTFDSRRSDSYAVVSKVFLNQEQTANPPMPTNPIDQSNHAFLEEDLSDYSFEKLRQGSQDVDISMSHYTACKLSIDLKIPDNFTGSYVVAAFHGVRGFGGNRYQLGITSCGVIFCQDHEPKTLDSCGKRPNLDGIGSLPIVKYLRLEQPHSDDMRLMPVAMDLNLQPLNQTLGSLFVLDDKTFLVFKEDFSNFYSIGLFGRVYSLDN